MQKPPYPSPRGFIPTAVPLPPPPAIDQRARDDAALIILAIGRGMTPEETALGCAHALAPLLDDPLERAEANSFVSLLAELLR
jgi:hypothetical protein